MPYWVIAYLIVFGVVAAAGIWDDWRTKRPSWFLACAVTANVTVAWLFTTYWHSALHPSGRFIAPVAYLLAMTWELYQAIDDTLDANSDPSISRTQRRTEAAVTLVILAVTCVPAYVVAGISAFR